MLTFKEIAKNFHNSFEIAQRDNGEEFSHLSNNAPEWMKNAVRSVHGNQLPNDYIYSMCHDVTLIIADDYDQYDDWDEMCDNGIDSEIADGQVPVYNADRVKWLASNLYNAEYVDEAQEELGFEKFNTFEAIGMGMYYQARELVGCIGQAIQDEFEAEQFKTECTLSL